MELRQLNPDDIESNMDLLRYAFQLKWDPERLAAKRRNFKPEQFWGAFEEGRLKAQLQLLPLKLYVQGRKLDMGGIANVSTWPEDRRRGHVTHLLVRVLRHMRENGQTISCLHPFSVGFYRKYGWEIYTEYKEYTIETKHFPPRAAAEGNVARVKAGIPLLQRVYEDYASRYNGTLVRDEAWWGKLLKSGTAAVYFRPDGKPGGYILYDIEERVMTVHEMVHEDERARQALWNFIVNHDSMIDKAILTAPMDDMLPFLLPNPRIVQEIMPYFMGRIVNVEEFVRQYAFGRTGEQTRISVKLTDSYAPWNEGVWNLIVTEDGRGMFTPSAPEENGEADLSCDIGSWTALLMGYRRPAELYGLGRIFGSENAVHRLDAVLPKRQTYLLDYF
ncbi:putative acetyltransferase [Paenibacillus forsythiae]|uniref:Acetyltransferase n=1 Tax=Paenibacillus forsythiae TaxID=365616 RepID=A0ABU3H4I6_9BACL|nr:GNAT family N-acetyltransferase [Paenibacillus forsythiae]MDT3424952.1 putative acetyltransferase [Paenibacillus forsythiae]